MIGPALHNDTKRVLKCARGGGIRSPHPASAPTPAAVSFAGTVFTPLRSRGAMGVISPVDS